MLGERREMLAGQLSVVGVIKGDTWKATKQSYISLPQRLIMVAQMAKHKCKSPNSSTKVAT